MTGQYLHVKKLFLIFVHYRRKFTRGLKRKPMALIKKLRKKKKECPPNEKPDIVKTHLRNMIVVPEMTGSIVGVYNGKVFTQVEIKPEMIGHYLGEFSISYKVTSLSLEFTRQNRKLMSTFISACEARKARYWSHSLLQIHPPQVDLLSSDCIYS